MARSEWKLYSQLVISGPEGMNTYEIYKGCVSLAINGQWAEFASSLPEEFQLLLRARILMHENKFDAAWSLLNSVSTNVPELEGDVNFIKGSICDRKRDILNSERHFALALTHYQKGTDTHKLLKASINREITREILASYQSGPLYFMKQEAFRGEMWDLVGNIAKSHACELISASQFREAIELAREAGMSYLLEGCSEDAAFAHLLQAIAHQCLGEFNEAAALYARVDLKNGKLTSYHEIYRSLEKGLMPKLPDYHALASAKWPVLKSKGSSIPALLLRRLEQGPATRDELITSVWGAQALDPSYTSRLYSAIRQLRLKFRVNVVFNGEAYCLSHLNSERASGD